MQLAQNFSQLQVPVSGTPWFNINGGTVGDLITALLKNVVFFAAAIALLVYLIFGGLQLMLSKGDPKAIQSARGKITNALIGFVIIAISFMLVRLIGQIFEIGVFSDIFK